MSAEQQAGDFSYLEIVSLSALGEDLTLPMAGFRLALCLETALSAFCARSFLKSPPGGYQHSLSICQAFLSRRSLAACFQ